MIIIHQRNDDFSRGSQNPIEYVILKALFYIINIFSTQEESKQLKPITYDELEKFETINESKIDELPLTTDELQLTTEQSIIDESQIDELQLTTDESQIDGLITDESLSTKPPITDESKIIENDLEKIDPWTPSQLIEDVSALMDELSQQDTQITEVKLVPIQDNENKYKLEIKGKVKIDVNPFNNNPKDEDAPSATGDIGICLQDIIDISGSAKINDKDLKKTKFSGKVKIGSDAWNITSKADKTKYETSVTLFKDLSLGLSKIPYDTSKYKEIQLNIGFKMLEISLSKDTAKSQDLLKKIKVNIVKLIKLFNKNTQCETSTSPDYIDFAITINLEKGCLTLEIEFTSAIKISLDLSKKSWKGGIWESITSWFEDAKNSLKVHLENECMKKTLYETKESQEYTYLKV